jgi:hypothetical protein
MKGLGMKRLRGYVKAEHCLRLDNIARYRLKRLLLLQLGRLLGRLIGCLPFFSLSDFRLDGLSIHLLEYKTFRKNIRPTFLLTFVMFGVDFAEDLKKRLHNCGSLMKYDPQNPAAFAKIP